MPTKASASEMTTLAHEVAVFVEERAPDRVAALASLEIAATMLAILPGKGAKESPEASS